MKEPVAAGRMDPFLESASKSIQILSNSKLESLEREILTTEAKEFLRWLALKFERERFQILQSREEQQDYFNKGMLPDFSRETSKVRETEWVVRAVPKEIEKRHVEITGPADAKMIIQALNSGADVFMADIEDSLSPTWLNVLGAQKALMGAYRKDLEYQAAEKSYKLSRDQLAVLMVRPRGWHLDEKHVIVGGKPISASLFDFGLLLFHNYKYLIQENRNLYLYLPKLESANEARLWANIFKEVSELLNLPKGFICTTVLIETLPAAFQMNEILFELRDSICGLNAGRWDYIFSAIKKLQAHRDKVLPDRKNVSMDTPPMRAYAQLLVETCHRRGAHAMGGMSAFIPSRKDAEVTSKALEKVKEDKNREIDLGFDGTWVAHPDLIPLVKNLFHERLQGKANQKNVRNNSSVTTENLLSFQSVPGFITEEGVRLNISVALQYMERWLSGTGAVAIHHLMEDAATAEISRAQLWQWLKFKQRLDNGTTFDDETYNRLLDEEYQKLSGVVGANLPKAREILTRLVKDRDFEPFLTVLAYQVLD